MNGRRKSPPYTPFAISTARTGEGTVIAPIGELDLASAGQLEREVTHARSEGSARIVLDLHQVDFIDSTGLRVLLALLNDAKRNGHVLTLVPPSPPARRIFEITGTRGVFDWQSGHPYPQRSGSAGPSRGGRSTHGASRSGQCPGRE